MRGVRGPVRESRALAARRDDTVTGLAAISGIFYPITHLPVFLQ
jgi:hypothetical protein